MRLVTLSAFMIAVIWFFTVDSAMSSSRQISLFGLPFMISARICACRSVSPTSAGVLRPTAIGGSTGASAEARPKISGGM